MSLLWHLEIRANSFKQRKTVLFKLLWRTSVYVHCIIVARKRRKKSRLENHSLLLKFRTSYNYSIYKKFLFFGSEPRLVVQCSDSHVIKQKDNRLEICSVFYNSI